MLLTFSHWTPSGTFSTVLAIECLVFTVFFLLPRRQDSTQEIAAESLQRPGWPGDGGGGDLHLKRRVGFEWETEKTQFWESLNRDWTKHWMEECHRKRPTNEVGGERRTFSHFWRQSDAPTRLFSQLRQLQAVCPAGGCGGMMNLLRYLDSIVDCNKEKNCSEGVCNIFIISYLVSTFP